MSSPVFAMTTRSSPATSSMPRASLAPPVPPARTTTGPAIIGGRPLHPRPSGVAANLRLTSSSVVAIALLFRLPASSSRSVFARRNGRGFRGRPQLDALQAGQPDPGVRLVAAVDRDQQGGERLGDARHLEAAAVDAAQAGDALNQLRRLALVRPPVAADQHVLVQVVVE